MAHKYDLEDRLVNFTCRMIEVVEALPNTRTGNYIAGQLVKSCHSPTFNYGEAQAAVHEDPRAASPRQLRTRGDDGSAIYCDERR